MAITGISAADHSAHCELTADAKVSEVNELISYESISGKVNDAINRIRSAVNSRIESGKIKVGRRSYADESEEQSITEHPTVGVIALAGDCDAIISDDRFLNQHANVDDGSAQALIHSSFELLDVLASAGSITPEDRLEYRTLLRRAGYFLVPVSGDELTSHLDASTVRDDKLVETAELKAIRENILRVRMSNWLRIPKEASWLDSLLITFVQVMKGQWKTNIDMSIVRARSDWIMEQIDVRGWAHCLGAEGGENMVKIGRRAYILMLLSAPADAPPEVRDEYWAWIEERVLASIKEREPDLYSWMLACMREQIAETAEMDLTEAGEK